LLQFFDRTSLIWWKIERVWLGLQFRLQTLMRKVLGGKSQKIW